ncbi:hypothetical protein N8D56_25085 (plasmid) [Devosia sp. A8/3-2]|nr:hypothetical protein N8D56_25085 [Devosia sp. A8/3-2]
MGFGSGAMRLWPCFRRAIGGQENLHARDKTRDFIGKQARSLDGGLTWSDEPFTGKIPGGNSLSGDEHVIEPLRSQPNIVPERDLPALDEPIDFTDPETLVMCAHRARRRF